LKGLGVEVPNVLFSSLSFAMAVHNWTDTEILEDDDTDGNGGNLKMIRTESGGK
jgi:hypothetical protein